MAPAREWVHRQVSRAATCLIAGLLSTTGWVEFAKGDEPSPSSHLCGTQLLRLQRETQARSPQASQKLVQAPLQDKPEVAVGTRLEFPVSGSPTLLKATCRYVGDHTFIFVEDRQWDSNGGPVLQSDVDGLGVLFDRATPADPARGVYELSVQAFGEPSDVDGYPQIFLLILDILRAEFIGYFDPAVAAHDLPELRRDVLYLDEFAVRRRAYLARGTMAHEFQHLIHWNHDRDEELWVNEGLSGYAEEVAGFPEADATAVPEFLMRPQTDLTSWPLAAKPLNYGATYLFASFLAERYGGQFIRSLVAEPRNGRFGIDAAFDANDIEQDFGDAWANWVVGNYASDDGEFSYSALDGRRVQTHRVDRLPLERRQFSVAGQWGTTNILFRTAGSFSIDFDGDDTGRFRVWSYGMRGGDAASLQELDLDDEMRGAVSVAEVDSLALIVGRTSIDGEGFEISARQTTVTAVQEVAATDAIEPTNARLGIGYPNPFNAGLRIPFSVKEHTEVDLSVYGTTGQRIRHLRAGVLPGGDYIAEWDGTDAAGRAVASGSYVVGLVAAGSPVAGGSETRLFSRVTLLK